MPRRLNTINQAQYTTLVGQVEFDQVQIRVVFNAQLRKTPEICRAGATESSVNGIAELQQVLSQVGAILARNARDERDSFGHFFY